MMLLLGIDPGISSIKVSVGDASRNDVWRQQAIPNKGKEFEQGKLSLEDFRAYTIENGEPAVKAVSRNIPKTSSTDLYNNSNI
jgi:hypothetical protein